MMTPKSRIYQQLVVEEEEKKLEDILKIELFAENDKLNC